MAYQYHTADVFTNDAFGGNQLAVLPDARGLTEQQMISIAREFNFSETVFVFPAEKTGNTRRIRIFMPGSELPFAGHPTVGTAFVLGATGEIDLDGDDTRIIFEEGVGPVPVLIKSRDGIPYFTQLTAARIPSMQSDSYDAPAIADILSLDADDIASESLAKSVSQLRPSSRVRRELPHPRGSASPLRYHRHPWPWDR